MVPEITAEDFKVMRNILRVCTSLFIIFGAIQIGKAAAPSSKPDKSPTGYFNSELPKWLRLSGEGRERMEALDGVSFASGTNTYLLQRLRLSLVATPRPWLNFTFQAQDARVFFTNV